MTLLILYIAIAMFIAWIWVDYFRLIDIYDRDALVNFVVCFLLGGVSVILVFAINDYFLDYWQFHLTSVWWKDLSYTVLKIGVVEEFSKISAFAVFYLLFKKRITEPIDVLAYTATAALGFSAVENVIYFSRYGASIIDGRAVLSTVGHMFDTTILGYGLVVSRVVFKGRRKWVVLRYFFFASLAHGIYDFTLMYKPFGGLGYWLMLGYFFVTIELFATMLNNVVNHSKFFNYKKRIRSREVAGRLLSYYLLLFIVQTVTLLVDHTLFEALAEFWRTLLVTGFIVVITTVRMSRFRLIKGHWSPIHISLPFSVISTNTDKYFQWIGLKIKINGDSENEAELNTLIDESLQMNLVQQDSNAAQISFRASVKNKICLSDNQVYYQLHCWLKDANEEPLTLLAKAKVRRWRTGEAPKILLLPTNQEFVERFGFNSEWWIKKV
jgi:RsiW-degrading membrane proteinase PrsW (M82 family)